MKISFFLRGTTLQVRVPYKGTYLRLSTGIKIPDHLKFYVSKQSVAGYSMEAKGINSEVVRHKAFIQEVLATGYDLKSEYESFTKPVAMESIEEEKFDIISICESYVRECQRGKITRKDGSVKKPSTIRTYNHAINTLKSYALIKGKIDLLEHNLSHLQDIQKKRAIAENWENYFKGFDMYMVQNGHLKNSRAIVMNVLNTIVKYYCSKLFILVPEIPKVNFAEKPIVVLDPEFVIKFMNDPLYEKLEGNMRFVWEVAATILVTTMRISDVFSLKWEHLSDRKDGLFLNKMNIKTGGNTNMILPTKLANVFRENMAKHGEIFTPTKDRENVLYANLPKLFAKYPELQHNHSAYEMNADGTNELVTQPLYEWVKPHMLRKTAITTMLVMGIDEQHVKFASGHVFSSKSFEKYRAFIDRNFNNQLNNYYGKM